MMKNKLFLKNIIFAFLLLVFLFFTCKRTVKHYYLENGALMEKYQVKFGTAIRDGYYKIYNPDGTLIFDGNYKNNMLNGKCSTFYDNGGKKYSVIYKENRLMEILYYFDIEGNKLDYGEIKDGNGYIKIYDDDGKLQEEGKVVNGLREGEWKLHNNSKKVFKVYYKNGILKGDKYITTTF